MIGEEKRALRFWVIDIYFEILNVYFDLYIFVYFIHCILDFSAFSINRSLLIFYEFVSLDFFSCIQ